MIEEGGAGGVEVFTFVADRAGAIAVPALAGGVGERALVSFAAANGGKHGCKRRINRLFEGDYLTPRVVIAALGAVGHRELIQPAREIDPELGGGGRPDMLATKQGSAGSSRQKWAGNKNARKPEYGAPASGGRCYD